MNEYIIHIYVYNKRLQQTAADNPLPARAVSQPRSSAVLIARGFKGAPGRAYRRGTYMNSVRTTFCRTERRFPLPRPRFCSHRPPLPSVPRLFTSPSSRPSGTIIIRYTRNNMCCCIVRYFMVRVVCPHHSINRIRLKNVWVRVGFVVLPVWTENRVDIRPGGSRWGGGERLKICFKKSARELFDSIRPHLPRVYTFRTLGFTATSYSKT